MLKPARKKCDSDQKHDWNIFVCKKPSLCEFHTWCEICDSQRIFYLQIHDIWCEIIKDIVNVFESDVTSHGKTSESRNGTTKYLTNIFLIFTNLWLIMSHIYDSSWNFSHILSGKIYRKKFSAQHNFERGRHWVRHFCTIERSHCNHVPRYITWHLFKLWFWISCIWLVDPSIRW